MQQGELLQGPPSISHTTHARVRTNGLCILQRQQLRLGVAHAPILQGLWSPALMASQGVTHIQPSDLSLGGICTNKSCNDGRGIAGPQPGMLLLTGANTGGKSTLLRAACLAAVMAQVSWLQKACAYRCPGKHRHVVCSIPLA